MATGGKPGKSRPNTRSSRALEKNLISDRRVRVAKLALQRVSLTEIAAQEGLSVACISRDLKAVRQAWLAESTETVGRVVAQELAALEEDEKSIREAIARNKVKPELQAKLYDRVLRIMDRRAKLLGLDAPVRHEVAGPAGGPVRVEHATNVDKIAIRSDPLARELHCRLLERIDAIGLPGPGVEPSRPGAPNDGPALPGPAAPEPPQSPPG